MLVVISCANVYDLAHRVSISMDAAFCVEALEEAFSKYGKPEIFNSDQGSQLGFKESSQRRFLERVIVGDQAPRRAFAIRGSCEVFH